MKNRDLPASFWQQPQRPSSNIRCEVSESHKDLLFETRTMFIRIPTPPDTNLLFSLFKILDQTSTIRHNHHITAHHNGRAVGSAIGDSFERRRRRLQTVRRTLNDHRPIITTHNNNNNSNLVPDMNTSAMEDAQDQSIHRSHIDLDDEDDDNSFGTNKSNHHRPDQMSFSDDDPYLCIGSKDRRVGVGHQHQQPITRIQGCGDNFSDLLSDLVVNL